MENDLIAENSPIKAAGSTNPFLTPKHYFESLKQYTIDRVKLSLSTESYDSDFITPDEYFENLSSVIESRIRLEDIKSLVQGTGMSVGTDYFKSSADQITQKAERLINKRGSVLKNDFNKWVKYAVAACLAGLVSIAIYVNQKDYSINSQLAIVPEAEIINYLQTNSETMDITSIIENINEIDMSSIDSGISDEDLNQYIETSL